MSDIKQSRVISINDLLIWRESGKNGLMLSPKYQRNTVWNLNMKSYLMDSIIRGYPIPPIFIRQQIDPTLKQTYREVIDGQQRIRSILEFLDGEFVISRTHNKNCGNKLFEELPNDIKSEILSFELQVEIINENDDSKIYDMFARLNTNNIALNRQELRNAKYWGEFKVFVYEYAAEKARDFFCKFRILTEKQITRMADTELLSSIIILLIDGIITETPAIIDKYYEKYNQCFENADEIRKKLDCIIELIEKYYKFVENNVVCFNRKTYFYTLFAFLAHQLYGIRQLEEIGVVRYDKLSLENIGGNQKLIFNKLVEFEFEFDVNIVQRKDKSDMYSEMVSFEAHHRKRTTSKNERVQRIRILNDYNKI